METTVTGNIPANAIRFAPTDAVNWLELTYVVDNDEPFHLTTALDAKPLPFTVSVKAGYPAYSPFGDSELIAGWAAA